MSVTKGVILVGGPSKGTRMRPLSLDCELKEKSGADFRSKTPAPSRRQGASSECHKAHHQPMIWHQLSALATVPGLSEIIIIGFYEDSVMSGFIKDSKREFPNVAIR